MLFKEKKHSAGFGVLQELRLLEVALKEAHGVSDLTGVTLRDWKPVAETLRRLKAEHQAKQSKDKYPSMSALPERDEKACCQR